MADYALAAQIAPFQAPNLLAIAQQGQQLQTNMLAAQKFRQDLALQNAMREQFAGGLSLTDPQAINRLAAINPSFAMDVAKGQASLKQSEAATAASRASAESSLAQSRLTGKQIEAADLALVGKYGDAARDAFGRISVLAQEDPALAAKAYKAFLADVRKKSETLASQFSPEFSPAAVQRGLLTLEQLQAQTLPQAPIRGKVGDVDVVYDPRNPTVAHEVGVVPFSAGGGIPGARQPAPVSGPMGGPPLTPASSTPVGAFGSLANAAPSLQATTTLPGSELAARQKLSQAGALAEQERQKTVARKTAEESVSSESRKRGIQEVLTAMANPEIEKLIMGSTSGSMQRRAAEAVGSVFGTATTGMQSIGQLETLAGDLKLRLLNGKLGAGISDKDVGLISDTLGDIANPDKPADQRLAAYRQLMNNLRASVGGGQVKVAPGGGSAKGEEVDMSNPLLGGRR